MGRVCSFVQNEQETLSTIMSRMARLAQLLYSVQVHMHHRNTNTPPPLKIIDSLSAAFQMLIINGQKVVSAWRGTDNESTVVLYNL